MSGVKRTDLRGADSEVLQILALQSRDPQRVRAVLDPRNPMASSVLPHVIPLLEVRTLAGDAMLALQRVAEQRSGVLLDALFDVNQPVAVRRRIARVLSAGRSQSVVDGLLAAMSDGCLDIRVQCARTLFRIRRQTPALRIDAERMLEQVRAELDAGAPDLAHVFTLLAFVVPIAPLRAAYRSLKSNDAYARGTALEYLIEVLPRDIAEGLLAVAGRLGS